MNVSKEKLNEDRTPVFGLTKSQLMPIVEKIVNETVDSFDVRIEHQVRGYYGYQAEKVIPTFTYTTWTGYTGEVTVFVKWFYRSGPAEAHHYAYLEKHQAPIPQMYKTLTSPDGREMLFLEYLEPIINNDEFLKDAERFHQFLSLMARFNAIQPSQEYAAQLSCHELGQSLTNAVSVLNSIWDYACKGELGNTLRKFCSSSGKLSCLQELAKQLVEPVNQMETELAHTDFYPENTGWRSEEEELLVFDLEFVGFAPRFFDIAGWLGAPDYIGIYCRPREELAQYYLEQYARWGGCPIPLEKFLEVIRVLWMTGVFKMPGWRLERALDGLVDWTDDCEEGRKLFRKKLYEDLNVLLLLGERCDDIIPGG